MDRLCLRIGFGRSLCSGSLDAYEGICLYLHLHYFFCFFLADPENYSMTSTNKNAFAPSTVSMLERQEQEV